MTSWASPNTMRTGASARPTCRARGCSEPAAEKCEEYCPHCFGAILALRNAVKATTRKDVLGRRIRSAG